ncbi:hypothetical protein BXZ70DRAFT_662907 [Cristinia sonorae]|uniref:Secreted protein n=1 Tax=Cristinia sonorae TaxID=1940300 RepID=A0A8K0UDQ4_9AGAR|nr:hypothetical protein BXZ70DRAFT_662907 [Cristinia sonorae]
MGASRIRFRVRNRIPSWVMGFFLAFLMFSGLPMKCLACVEPAPVRGASLSRAFISQRGLDFKPTRFLSLRSFGSRWFCVRIEPTWRHSGTLENRSTTNPASVLRVVLVHQW